MIMIIIKLTLLLKNNCTFLYPVKLNVLKD